MSDDCEEFSDTELPPPSSSQLSSPFKEPPLTQTTLHHTSASMEDRGRTPFIATYLLTYIRVFPIVVVTSGNVQSAGSNMTYDSWWKDGFLAVLPHGGSWSNAPLLDSSIEGKSKRLLRALCTSLKLFLQKISVEKNLYFFKNCHWRFNMMLQIWAFALVWVSSLAWKLLLIPILQCLSYNLVVVRDIFFWLSMSSYSFLC